MRICCIQLYCLLGTKVFNIICSQCGQRRSAQHISQTHVYTDDNKQCHYICIRNVAATHSVVYMICFERSLIKCNCFKLNHLTARAHTIDVIHDGES